MATVQQTSQTELASSPSNGTAEITRLSALVEELRKQNNQLRQTLAEAEQEREWYRKAIYEYEREKREFEDVDIASLEAMSAGPVEPIR